jgi:hypothetical protein
MFQEQRLTGIVEDDPPGGHSETRVADAHDPAPKLHRQTAPNLANQVFKQIEIRRAKFQEPTN